MSLIPFHRKHIPAARAGFDEFDRLFDGFFRNALTNLSAAAPSVTDLAVRMDISETANAYHIKADLPGIDEKDVELTLDDGVLTLSGEKQSEKEDDGKTFHRVERSYGRFVRSLQLPGDADGKAVRAQMKNGVLEIEIGKLEAVQKKPQRIDVKSV